MFAHEVFKSFHKDDWQKQAYRMMIKNYDETFRSALQAINDSTKFHMGKQSDILNAVPGKIVFEEVFSQCHFPYSDCWFDYVSDREADSPMTQKYKIKSPLVRSALLCNEMDDGLFSVLHFTAAQDPESWTMDPVTSFVANKPLGTYPLLQHVIAGDKLTAYGATVVLEGNPSAEETLQEMSQELYYNASTDVATLGRFLMLLNCKNSLFEEHQPKNKPLRKNGKRAKREPGSFKYAYKLLRLDLGKKGGGVVSLPRLSHLWQNPIHTCRGHFRTYTPERRLFGRYTGRYWIPSHVRGHYEEGVILKEYDASKRST